MRRLKGVQQSRIPVRIQVIQHFEIWNHIHLPQASETRMARRGQKNEEDVPVHLSPCIAFLFGNRGLYFGPLDCKTFMYHSSKVT